MDTISIIILSVFFLLCVICTLYFFWFPKTNKLRISTKLKLYKRPDNTSEVKALYRPEIFRFPLGWSGFYARESDGKIGVSNFWYYNRELAEKNIEAYKNLKHK